jgi:hypothetical protein
VRQRGTYCLECTGAATVVAVDSVVSSFVGIIFSFCHSLIFFGSVGKASLGCTHFHKAAAGIALIRRTNTGALRQIECPRLFTLWFPLVERGFLVPLRTTTGLGALRSGKRHSEAHSTARAVRLHTPDIALTASARESGL